MSEFFHLPVMVSEVMEFLCVKEGGFYVDCTLGGGGHSLAIIQRGGSVLGIDRDCEAVAYAVERLSEHKKRFRAKIARFSCITEVAGIDIGSVDGIVMDLGVSSRMINDSSRGFSYRHEGPLLMTMEHVGETACDVVNNKSARELTAIFRDYGEERNAARIARAIVDTRSRHPIKTTGDLASIVEKTVGARLPQKSKARIFQALRIYVNNEIEELRRGLDEAVLVLRSGGRLCVISYHSLEDRVVKNFLRTMSDPCICPPGLPVCRCGLKPEMKIITRKPVRPSETEVARNSRARSALLRVGEKIDTVIDS
ncbi:16S rRNA (cytosine(1402)-N(4))-methyltransferase RsmH [Candidatus Latescibacterota bacterium]